MENFCPKVGELGGFIEADDLDAPGVRAQPRISRHHAIDISPDFNALGIKRRSKNRRRKIRAATSDRGRNPGASRSNKSAHHRNFAGVEQRLEFLTQPFVRFVKLRNGTGVAVVSEKALPRIDVRTRQSTGSKCRGNDLA